MLLPLDGSNRIDLVEGILLEYDEVYQFRFPKGGMVLHRHTIIAQDVDLLGYLLAPEQPCFGFVHLLCPVVRDMLRNEFLKFRVFDVLGV